MHILKPTLPPKSNSEPCYFIQIEKKVSDGWRKYTSFMELNSLYKEEDGNCADLFFKTYIPHSHDFEDGLYRLAKYSAVKVPYSGETHFELEDETLEEARCFTIKTEKKLEWQEHTKRIY